MKNSKYFIVLIASILCNLVLSISIYANEFIILRTDSSLNNVKISNSINNKVLSSCRKTDSNFVYLSTNNGESWTLIFKERRIAYLPYLANIEKLLIVSDSSFLLSYDKGLVIVSTDKGKSWRQQIPDSTFMKATHNSLSISFPDNLSSGLYFLLLDSSEGKRFVRLIITD